MSKIFVISGQSGVGKGSVQKVLKDNHLDFYDVVTCTTRSPRPHEIDGKDYFFLTEKEFKNKISNNEFLEYAHVHDWIYGTPKSEIEKAKSLNKNTFLEIDVQGAIEVKKIIPNAVLIFISYEEGDLNQLIRSRIKHDTQRGDLAEAEIKKRIESAQKEETYKKYYDYIVINPEGHPEKAVEEINNIITKETNDN